MYKLSGDEVDTNIYGDQLILKQGKVTIKEFKQRRWLSFMIQLQVMISSVQIRKRLLNINLMNFMRQINLYLETGDIIFWDDQYYEVGNVIQEQYVGGQPEKQHSIICETHLTRTSNLNIVER